MERFEVRIENVDQLQYLLHLYILEHKLDDAMNLVGQMFSNNLSYAIYDTCLNIYFYYSCIFLPNYIDALLAYEEKLIYYEYLVLHLIYAPKEYLFTYLPSYKPLYFYLTQENTYKQVIKRDNTTLLEKSFTTYYNSMCYYNNHVNFENQCSIANDFSTLLYYLLTHTEYDTYVDSVWNAQFSFVNHNKDLLYFVKRLHLLHNYVSSRTHKILILLLSLVYRFHDVLSLKHLYSTNVNKIDAYIYSYYYKNSPKASPTSSQNL